MKHIQLIQQRRAMDCVSACLAMVTGQDLETVYGEFHTKFHNYQMSIGDYLDQKDVEFDAPVPAKTPAGSLLEAGFIYILTVPCLAQNGMFHCIVADLRDYEYLNHVRVYDPAKGKPGVMFYSHHKKEIKENPLAFQLKSWLIDAKITSAPALEYDHNAND